MIPVAAINTAVYDIDIETHQKVNYDIDINEARELYKKRNLILEYLEKKFKVNKIEFDEEPTQFTIYRLRFGNYYGIGIRISNEMIVNADIEWLYKYCYDLVFSELMKNTKEKYVNLESEVN